MNRSNSVESPDVRIAGSGSFVQRESFSLRNGYCILGLILLVSTYALASTITIATARWIQDDTFIFLQYARNLAHGNGLVFNLGERICAITSPLWTFLVCPLFFLADDPARLTSVFSAILGGLAVVALVWLSPTDTRAIGGLGSAATLLLHPVFRVWSISGMETSLFLLLIVLSLSLSRGRKFVWSGVVLGLAMLTRPEGYLLALSSLAAFLIRREKALNILRWGAVAFVMIAPWLIFSRLYYGSVIPQSILAKRIVYSEVLYNTPPLRTLRILLATGLVSLTSTVLSSVGFFVSRKSLRRDIDILGFGVLYLAFYMVGRSFIHDWYIAPIILVKAYGTGLACAAVGGTFRFRVKRINRMVSDRALALLGVAVVCAMLVPLTFTVEKGLRTKQEYIDSTLRQIAAFSRDWPNAGAIFVNAIGYIGYYGQRPVIDSLGLISPKVLPSFRRRAWVEPIRILAPEIVVLGPTAGTNEITPDLWFRKSYHLITEFAARPELAQFGGKFSREYQVFVKTRN